MSHKRPITLDNAGGSSLITSWSRMRSASAISLVGLLVCLKALLVMAQYDQQQQSSYHEAGGGYDAGGYAGSDYNQAADERPKVHLGIRLRIPAIKFELPRFSLPKITVSAKIRQPDRPRTITLPEINLDTSSKVAPPDGAESPHAQQAGYRAVGAYQPTASQQQLSYGGYQQQHSGGYDDGHEKTSVLSFSTDEHTSGYGNRHRPVSPHHQHPIATHPMRYTANTRPAPQQFRYNHRVAYGASSELPTYVMASGYPDVQPARQ